MAPGEVSSATNLRSWSTLCPCETLSLAHPQVLDVPQGFLRVSGSSQDLRGDNRKLTAMSSDVDNFNRCILNAGTFVLRKAGARIPSIMSNVSGGGAETNDQASEANANAAASLHTKIFNLLLGDSLALAVRKGLENPGR